MNKKNLCRSILSIAFSAVILAGCTHNVSTSKKGSDPESGSDPLTNSGTTVTTVQETVTVSNGWVFSDLSSVACEAVDASTAIATSDALAAAAVTYSTFGAATGNKFSLKNDIEYLSSDGSYTAKIHSLGADGATPIQYCGYDASDKSCTVKDCTAGRLQIKDDAFTISSVQGPFKIQINYGANSKDPKTDGRYAYIRAGKTLYRDEAVIAANSLAKAGVSFTVEYSGTDVVDVVVGSTNWVCLYDVMFLKDVVYTVETTTTVNEDGSTTVTKVTTDENGNVIDSTTETTSSSSGSGEAGSGSGTGTSGGVTAPVTPVIDPTLTAEYTNGSKIGRRSKLNEIDTSKIKDAIRVSSSAQLESALTQVKAGGAIVIAQGTYTFDHQLTIAKGNDGTESARKYIMPESNASVILDFSSQSYDSSDTSKNARGLQINANYWHVFGITVYGAADNGIFVAGKNNIIERCVLQANRDTGLQISRSSSSVTAFADWPSDNLILNCTSFDNHDPATDENADGFASKLTCGDGNVFDGCISYCNSDDGWDLYAKEATGSIGVVTIRNCVAFGNGKLTSGTNFANGDMNGYKLGGSNNAVPTPHVVYNCLAFGNGKDGFTDNGNGGALSVHGCTSVANTNSNFNFYRTYAGGVFRKLISATGSASVKQVDKFGGKESEVTVAARIADSVYLGDKSKKIFYYVTDETPIYNGDKLGTQVSDPYSDGFVSVTLPAFDGTVHSACRNADGTVNMGGLFESKDTGSYGELGCHFGDEAYEVLQGTPLMN